MLSKFLKVSKTSPWTLKKDVTNLLKSTCYVEERKDFKINKIWTPGDYSKPTSNGEWLLNFENQKHSKFVFDFLHNNPCQLGGTDHLTAFYVKRKKDLFIHHPLFFVSIIPVDCYFIYFIFLFYFILLFLCYFIFIFFYFFFFFFCLFHP
jgi:hypothetical protein